MCLCLLSVRLCVFLCLALLCVCESHPLTAAELSLIQLCLLSCLPVASTTPSSALALPRSSPPCFPAASCLYLGACLWVSESPLKVFSIPVCDGYYLYLYISTCPFSPSPTFFSCLSYLFVQQTSSHASHPLYQLLCWCLGPGDGSHLSPALKA